MSLLSIKEAENIYCATLGLDKHFVKCEGGYRWSRFKEDDERDDWESNGAVFTGPDEAIASLWSNAGFIRGVEPDSIGRITVGLATILQGQGKHVLVRVALRKS